MGLPSWCIKYTKVIWSYLAGVLDTLGSQALPPCNGVRDGS